MNEQTNVTVERRKQPRHPHQQVERELHAVERAFLRALERNDAVSDYLVRSLMKAVRGDDGARRQRAR